MNIYILSGYNALKKRGISFVKGYQRKVIFLKNTGSPYFDEAYFVVSRAGASVGQSDMVEEANRIISESLEDSETRIRGERVKRRLNILIPFFLGVLISCLSVGIYHILCAYF